MENNIKLSESPVTFSVQQPPFITFHDVKTQEKIGELHLKDGILSFEGNADESAQIFFDQILKKFNKPS